MRRSRWLIGCVLAVLTAGMSALVGRAAAQSGTHPIAVPVAPAYGQGGMALAEVVAGSGNTMRVLMIGAHPDDEDTRLLTWLARGRHVETAYLSLTRGDGGQNLIGNELGDGLGVIRTEELLAARRIDGAHQYFSRAYDFGFSKTAAETFAHWPRDSVLRDVVTVIRAFRPHVIVAVFSGTPRDGHGHHQVSGILAREAYDVSGDTIRFPAAGYGPAWTASKFYRDRSYFGGGENPLAIDVGAYDPLLGVTYAEIAAASRSQHRSQGFGNIIGPAGPVTGYIFREAARVNSAIPAGQERSMFDGIDTSWARLGLLTQDLGARALIDSLPVAIRHAQSEFVATNPARSLAALGDVARLESLIATRLVVPDELAELSGAGMEPVGAPAGARAMPSGPAAMAPARGAARAAAHAPDPDLARTIQVALARINRAQELAAGLELHAVASHDVAAVESGPSVALALNNRAPVALDIDSLGWSAGSTRAHEVLPAGRGAVASDGGWSDTLVVRDTVVTQPWWLRSPRRGDMFTQPVSRIAEDQRPSAAALALALRSEGAQTGVDFEPQTTVVQRIAEPGRGEVDRPLAFAPAITLTLDRTVEYVPAGTRIDRSLRVLLRSAADSARAVSVSLHLPAGLTTDTATRQVTVDAFGTRGIDFHIRGALPPGDATLSVTAESRGRVYRSGYVPIDYEHIRPQRLYRPAEVHLSVVDVKIPPGLTVAYIPGVGDNVEPMLEQLGLRVTVLDPAALPATNLSRFTTIVVGPRAYEASPDLKANNGRLLEFARAGGTLVVQYGQYEMAEPGMLPFPITLGRPADRVTEEVAPVRILDSAAAVLNLPNKIRPADFADWVQERSSYMPHTFDGHYHAVLSMNDPGEPPNDAGILIAPVGTGTYVYTTLVFFRQLPAGIPGPARLFVNLLVAGRRCCDTM